MDRRQFVKSAGGLALFSTGVRATPRRKLRVCVLGLCGRAISAADAIRCTAPFWLDDERFSLSAFVLWHRTLHPQGRMFGAFGEVPARAIRAWGDLQWIADDLKGADVAIVLVDLWADSRDSVAAEVISEVGRFVPNVAAVALEPWEVVGEKLVPDPDPGVRRAIERIGAVCRRLQVIPGNGVPDARLRLAEVAGAWPWSDAPTLAEVEELVPWQDLNRSVTWSETDQLASPVIKMLASASRMDLLPSTCRREIKAQYGRRILVST